MSSALLTLVIVTLGQAAPIESRFPDAVPIFQGAFEQPTDADFDGWPDRWSRKRGPGFPHYIEVRIEETSAIEGRRALHVACDGGAAACYGPPIPVSPRFAYVLEGWMRTADLVNDKARLALTLIDEHMKPIETFTSVELGGTSDWTKVRVGPVSPRSVAVRYAMVSGQVNVGATADLGGEVWFDDFWLARTPRLVVSASAPHGLYGNPSDIAVTGELSGLESQDFTVVCELLDVSGKKLEATEQALSLEKVIAAPQQTASAGDESAAGFMTGDEFAGRFSWRPKVPGMGYYRVRIAAAGREGTLYREELPLLVIPGDEAVAGLEFGWSLPDGEDPVPLADLPKLLVRFGVQRLKFPVWFAEDDTERAAALVALAERLNNRQIDLIALLNNPPPAVHEKFKSDAKLLAIDVFGRSPELWYPALEPVLARLSMNIRYWQLGADDDRSLVASGQLVPRITDVKKNFDRIGQDLRVGFGWDWQYELPPTATKAAPKQRPPWRFLTLGARPGLSPAELGQHLAALGRSHGERWVSIRALPSDQYSLNARVDDLAGQMIVAKQYGAEGIFLDDPFDDRCGLLDGQGRPSELVVAWRTATMALAGANYVGQMDLPSGGSLPVFARDRAALVCVPAGQPRLETLAWGANVRQQNVWGQPISVQSQGDEQTITVGELPSFVEGVDLGPAAWRTGVKLVPNRVASVLGQPQSIRLALRNTFPQSVSGTAQVVGPESWRLDAPPMPFDMAAGGRVELPVELSLPHDATLGEHLLKIEFEINADQLYRVTAYPRLQIGDGTLRLEVDSRINERGQLEIEQRLTNASDREVTFKCFLLSPGRRRLRRQVVEHRRGVDVQTYLLENGSDLLGQSLLLRAEEVGGTRTLNLSFTAEP